MRDKQIRIEHVGGSFWLPLVYPVDVSARVRRVGELRPQRRPEGAAGQRGEIPVKRLPLEEIERRYRR